MLEPTLVRSPLALSLLLITTRIYGLIMDTSPVGHQLPEIFANKTAGVTSLNQTVCILVIAELDVI